MPQLKRKRDLATKEEEEVQIKVESDEQERKRMCSNERPSQSASPQWTTALQWTAPWTASQSTASQSPTAQSTTSQSTASQSAASQSTPSQSEEAWFKAYQSCKNHFLAHAQTTSPVRALCAQMNILLPYQKIPIRPVSLLPYIRRLVCMGRDTKATLKTLFGDEWCSGIGAMHKNERQNYLFAAKSADWLRVKAAYDIGDDETVPYIVPLKDAQEEEIIDADREWGEWLANADWMLGERRPKELDSEAK